MKKLYNKLVRDNIIKIIERNGKACEHRNATLDAEYEKYLNLKLMEEVEEFIEDPCSEEAADILEVLDAMLDLYSISKYQVETDQILKRESRGSYRDRIILESVTGREE